ncbi:MAG: hypothetical protein ACFE9Z_01015 [Promethearchaeota archaeon]
MIVINIKDNLWIISLVAGILGVISIFLPVWTYNVGGDFAVGWLWGTYIYNGLFDSIPIDEPIVILGIVGAIIIAIGAVILLIAGIIAKIKDRSINLLYLIGGILPIIAAIIYIAGVAVEYPAWWMVYTINVAGIFPFIAGGLGIAAGILGLILGRKE